MNSEVKPNYHRFDRLEDKPFFAAYLNTALQNVFICLRDICERIGLPFDKKQDRSLLSLHLWQQLDEGAKPEVAAQLIELLRERFPFLKLLSPRAAFIDHGGLEPGPADYQRLCKALLQQLYEFRDYYSHAACPSYELLEDTVEYCRILFDAGRNKVKKRFSLPNGAVNHLVRKGKGNQELRNFKYAFMERGALTEKGLAFFTCLWLQRKNAQEFLKKLEGFKRSESPSQQATLELFTFYGLRLPQPRLTSDTSSTGLLLDMVNELKRCPAALYPLLGDADRDRFKALPEDMGIDTAEEYASMPVLKRSDNRFYYFALRYFDRHFKTLRFEVDLGNYCFHSYPQVIGETARMRRWMKRMTAFGRLEDFEAGPPPHWEEKMLTLTERNETGATVYVTDTTPHYHINNGNIGLRMVGQSQYDDSKAAGNLWPALPPYDGEGQKGPAGNAPALWLSLYELPAMVFYHLLQQRHPQLPTVESIITEHRKRVQKFFGEVANGRLAGGTYSPAELDALLAQWGLQRQQVPKPIVRYLQGKPLPGHAERAKRLLLQLIAETELRQQKAKTIQEGACKRPGSEEYVALKNGHLADFLARDILRLQPATGQDKGKANSTEFQVLQASLAYFAANKKDLTGLFALCNLVGSANPHPFLNTVDIGGCRGLLDFYTQYLQKRLTYLQGCLKKGQYDQYHFLKLPKSLTKPVDGRIKRLAEELAREAVGNLPRGLFLQPLLKLLQADAQGAAVAAAAQGLERVNVAWLIQTYFTTVLQDEPQPFYAYKRSYELLNKLYDTRGPNQQRQQLPRQFFAPAELEQMGAAIDAHMKRRTATDQRDSGKRKELGAIETATGIADKYWKAYTQLMDTEKDIRWHKTCDMVLFMLVDDLLRKEFLTDARLLQKKDKPATAAMQVQLAGNYQLRTIRPDAESGLLSLPTTASMKMHYRYETNMDHILYQPKSPSVPSETQYKTVVQPTVKVKNYGDFRALLKDRRIESLLPYIASEEVQFEALRRELEWYEEARRKVFEKVHAFEMAATGGQYQGKHSLNHHKLLAGYLPEGSLRLAELRQLRNAFSHSMYPDWLLFKDRVNGGEFNTLRLHTTEQPARQHSVALQLLNLVNVYYNELLLVTGTAHGRL